MNEAAEVTGTDLTPERIVGEFVALSVVESTYRPGFSLTVVVDERQVVLTDSGRGMELAPDEGDDLPHAQRVLTSDYPISSASAEVDALLTDLVWGERGSLGPALANRCCPKLVYRSRRDGIEWAQEFENGRPLGPPASSATIHSTGAVIELTTSRPVRFDAVERLAAAVNAAVDTIDVVLRGYESVVEPMTHRCKVDEREIRRHEQRRGRRHAYEHLDPGRTALVVVDMVPFFVADNGFVRGIVAPINDAAATVRRLGGVVAWVAPVGGPPSPLDDEFYGPEVAASYARSGGTGPIQDRLWHELALDPGDLFVEKRAPSAFFPGRCDLHELLSARRIDSVVVAGTVANVCCESTVRDARTLGYRAVMLADATAAPTDEMLNATLRTVYRSFGDVRSTTELAELLGGGPA